MFRHILATVLALCALVSAAGANQRIALVVGNGAYTSVSALDNPANDAALMRDALEAVGFQVTTLIDADRQSFERAISTFGKSLRADPETVGLFYYAGHGVQSFGSNYLIPVDAMVSDQADLDLVAIETQSVLRQMYTAGNRTNIVILDACRDNPFVTVPSFDDQGLAEMKAPTGTFLSYSTAPGMIALDGNGQNSPFTSALSQEIVKPGAQIEQVFKNVRRTVLDATNGVQVPWDTSSLTVDFAFMAEKQLTMAEVEERQHWEAVRESGDSLQFVLFLRAYPDGPYSDDARRLLAKAMEAELTQGQTKPEAPKAPAATTPSGPAPDEVAAFEAAQAVGSIEGWRGFLTAFPNGTFAEIASTEIAAIESKTNLDPDGLDQTAALAAPKTDPVQAPKPDQPITFDMAIVAPDSVANGLSIADLIVAKPEYPPVEGLPESYWKNSECSSCHQWDRASLCEQGTFYVKDQTRSLRKEHPFGGAFKRQLKGWAALGCK